MTNIWGYLTQTASVSLIAALIFLIKALLNDKLSPRWQYGIWGILALRILFPVPIETKILLPISVWVETLKSVVEKGLNSNYSEVYVPAKLTHIFPNALGTPTSITDWLFVLYAVGFFASIMWYLISYLRLHRMLKKGTKPSEKNQQRIQRVCKKYDLKDCNTVAIKGLPSAFVCGGWRPILALPADKEVDEKVILHELLHLKYHDEMQSFLWCILRSFHWCNPFLQYVFHRIENDMEALCDQRVLERLEGEERREYGMILLDMANEKYARMPGTSSISNGGKNVKRRIATIVRFKKYPKGMSLVSVCIGILLLFAAFVGQTQAGNDKIYQPLNYKALQYSLANARISRCTTLAGALDTYAKGLMLENGVYIATVSPMEKQAEIEEKLERNKSTSNPYYHCDSGEEFDQMYSWEGYTIFNLIEVAENYYEAILSFTVVDRVDGRDGSLLIPLKIHYEDAWVVEESGERKLTPFEVNTSIFPSLGIPTMKSYESIGEYGTAKVNLISLCKIKNEVPEQTALLGTTPFNTLVNTDAEFETICLGNLIDYTCKTSEDGNLPEETFGVQYNLVDEHGNTKMEEIKRTQPHFGEGPYGNICAVESVTEGDYEYRIWHSTWKDITLEEIEKHIPESYKMNIYWDGEVVEELVLTENDSSPQTVISISEDYDSHYSVYLEPGVMRRLKEQKDLEYQEALKNGKIEGEASYYAKRAALEEAMFLYGSLELEEIEKLESYGIYECTSFMSPYPSMFLSDMKILEPKLYYNAENKNWIVTCGGYNLGEDYKKQLIPGEVGTRDRFGYDIFELSKEHQVVPITDAYAMIQDREGLVRKETENRSGSFTDEGVHHELQDYTYLDDSLGLQYVGARWYCATSYGPGFEENGGVLTAFYNHTD